MIRIERKRRRPRVEIVPMIDVMFFLIVFFMLFTTFRSTTTGVDVTLPEASEVEAQQSSELVITVRSNGALFLGGQSSNAARIQQAARLAVRDNPNVVAVVRADAQARWDWVVQAMDAAASGGVRNVVYAIDRREEG